MCITTNQPHTESNPNRDLNRNMSAKQHVRVSAQLDKFTVEVCPTYQEKFMRGNVIAPFFNFPPAVVAVPQPYRKATD